MRRFRKWRCRVRMTCETDEESTYDGAEEEDEEIQNMVFGEDDKEEYLIESRVVFHIY